MEAQGYAVKKNVLFQDNQSTTRTEVNGRNLCTGNLRHINIRYLFVKERVYTKKMEAHYCPTHLMLEYFKQNFTR